MQLHDITTNQTCQDTLETYARRKQRAMIVGGLYMATKTHAKYGPMIYHCGDQIIIRKYEAGDIDTAYTMYCGARLCPICARKRSIVAYAQLSRTMDYIDAQRTQTHGAPYSYMMITLTVRNTSSLADAMDMMQSAYTRLTRRQAWQRAIKGAYRTTEITINPTTLEYHPHYHIICAVTPSYFTSSAYISHATLTELWRSCAQLDYDPICDIRKCYGSTASARAEATKYAVKGIDPLADIPLDEAAAKLDDLHTALHGRKLRQSYGIIRQAQNDLHLSDTDEALISDDTPEDQLLSKLRPETSYVYDLIQYDMAQHAYRLVPTPTKYQGGLPPVDAMYRVKLDALRHEQAILCGDDDDPLHVIQYIASIT